MGSMNQSGRHKKEYIGDNLDLKVYPKDCVPENRPHGSWTNGVKAWERGKNGSSDKVVGWFYAPDTETRVGKPARVVLFHFLKSKKKNESLSSITI